MADSKKPVMRSKSPRQHATRSTQWTPDSEMFQFEREQYDNGFLQVAGIDEAGRGCLAGPVVAAAVCFPRNVAVPRVNDSKQLSAKQRDELFDEIRSVKGVRYAIAEANASEIDEWNILRATHLAMRRAAEQLLPLDYLLIDGLPVRGMTIPYLAIVKGDARSASIAAASILAKVWRDRLMIELSSRYPGYGLEVHKGYGTRGHLEALRRLGATPIHRRSFAPVRKVLERGAEQMDLF